MVNLLPKDAERTLRIEYYLRLIAVLFILLAVSFSIGAGLLMPSYLLAKNEADESDRYLRALEESADIRESTGATRLLSILAERVRVLTDFTWEPLVPSYMEDISNLAPQGVLVDKLIIRRTAAGDGEITLSGVSSTRSALLEYGRTLNEHTDFDGVSVPVSQLVSETDIPFSLVFSFKKEESL